MVEINEYKLEKTDELNGLDEKLRSRTIKNRFLERLNRIKINKKKKDKWNRVIRDRNKIDETIKSRGRIKKFFCVIYIMEKNWNRWNNRNRNKIRETKNTRNNN